jgi:ferric hydroxamate transport system substrate-binding protein
MKEGEVLQTPRAEKRRALLRALGAAALLNGAIAARAATASRASAPARVVVLSWELTEMLLSLGVAPVGVPAPAWYTRDVVEPPLPQGVTDVGLLFQPNYDLLYELRPDLILVTPAHASVRDGYERLAPTLTLGAYMSDPQPYRAMRAEALTLGRRLDREAQAEALLARTETVIAQSAAALAGAHTPVCVAQVVDDRHVRVYGSGSLFDEILQSLGLRNAATTMPAGAPAALISSRTGAGVIELERLAQLQDANLLCVDGGAPGGLAALQGNPVWRHLPFSEPGRSAMLPVIAATGALVSVQRFARAVACAVPSMRTPHVI